MLNNWCGVPISEVPRYELEIALINTYGELEYQQKLVTDLLVENAKLHCFIAKEKYRHGLFALFTKGKRLVNS